MLTGPGAPFPALAFYLDIYIFIFAGGGCVEGCPETAFRGETENIFPLSTIEERGLLSRSSHHSLSVSVKVPRVLPTFEDPCPLFYKPRVSSVLLFCRF